MTDSGDEPRVMTPAGHVVLSCEHAGNHVPPEFAALFDSAAAREALESHRGWDPGSLAIGEAMAGVLDAPLVVQRVTRLLVECNRSLDHPRLFSEFSAGLGGEERRAVVERYWRAHRERVRELVGADEVEGGGCGVGRDRGVAEGPRAGDGALGTAPVVHIGVHTFSPVWKGRERETDIGLLYDPGRRAEAELARGWRKAIYASPALLTGPLRVHLNRPYRGWTDGLTTALRGELPESRYLGIELEVSQRFGSVAGELGRAMGEALEEALEGALAG